MAPQQVTVTVQLQLQLQLSVTWTLKEHLPTTTYARLQADLGARPGGKSLRQVRPSVGDSLPWDNSSPGVPRGRLEASISGTGKMLFQSPRDR